MLEADEAVLNVFLVAIVGGWGGAKGELEGGKHSRGLRFRAALAILFLHGQLWRSQRLYSPRWWQLNHDLSLAEAEGNNRKVSLFIMEIKTDIYIHTQNVILLCIVE